MMAHHHHHHRAGVPPEQGAVYRRQLLEEMRVCVKCLVGLVDRGGNAGGLGGPTTDRGSGGKHALTLDYSTSQVDTLCLTLEKILRHGLKDKSGFFSKRDYWNFIELLCRYEPAQNSIQSVSQLSHIKTLPGRGRAWLCFALVEKRLEEYLSVLVSFSDELTAWHAFIQRKYESYALLQVREETDMLLAILAPLSLLDFDLCLKDIDFDSLLQQRAFLRGLVSDSQIQHSASLPPPVPLRSKHQYKHHTSYSFASSSREPHATYSGPIVPVNSEVASVLRTSSQESALPCTITDFQQSIRSFAIDCGWNSHPHNLVLGLVREIGLVGSRFHDKASAEAEPGLTGFTLLEKQELADNLGGVFLQLLLLSNQCGINLDEAATRSTMRWREALTKQSGARHDDNDDDELHKTSSKSGD